VTFVLVFVGGWLLLLGGICALVWTKHRRTLSVSEEWRRRHDYKRQGDVPPGTSRQEEGR